MAVRLVAALAIVYYNIFNFVCLIWRCLDEFDIAAFKQSLGTLGSGLIL
jgi:hypothetical protein